MFKVNAGIANLFFLSKNVPMYPDFDFTTLSEGEEFILCANKVLDGAFSVVGGYDLSSLSEYLVKRTVGTECFAILLRARSKFYINVLTEDIFRATQFDRGDQTRFRYSKTYGPKFMDFAGSGPSCNHHATWYDGIEGYTRLEYFNIIDQEYLNRNGNRTNTCTKCNYYNEYMEPVRNYVCTGCRIEKEAWS